MIKKGDKIVAIKDIGQIINVGDIFEVLDISGDGEGIEIELEDVHILVRGFNKFFEKYEPIDEMSYPTVTEELVDAILDSSEFIVNTIFDKCTVVSAKLPNGFVITESSACVCPENYDEYMGIENCINKIRDKIWELEGYKLQSELWEYEYEPEVELEWEECEHCSCHEKCND